MSDLIPPAPGRPTERRRSVGAALIWFIAVALGQLVTTGFIAAANLQSTYQSLGEVMDVRDGPGFRRIAGFPLAVAEATCDRTMVRQSFHPDIGLSEDERTECVSGGRSTPLSWPLLVANVALTALPLAFVAGRSGARYPLPALAVLAMTWIFLDRPEGLAGDAASLLIWAIALGIIAFSRRVTGKRVPL